MVDKELTEEWKRLRFTLKESSRPLRLKPDIIDKISGHLNHYIIGKCLSSRLISTGAFRNAFSNVWCLNHNKFGEECSKMGSWLDYGSSINSYLFLNPRESTSKPHKHLSIKLPYGSVSIIYHWDSRISPWRARLDISLMLNVIRKVFAEVIKWEFMSLIFQSY